MKPLSQTGLPRVLRNAKQRPYDDTGVAKVKRSRLDALNEQDPDSTLHPTKGFRRLNVKRDRAQVLMAEARQGHGRSLDKQRRFLREGI